jgi:hypothetical protein
MRYRRLHYRYAMVVYSGLVWLFGELSQSDRVTAWVVQVKSQ